MLKGISLFEWLRRFSAGIFSRYTPQKIPVTLPEAKFYKIAAKSASILLDLKDSIIIDFEMQLYQS